jgi:hypothetical protein
MPTFFMSALPAPISWEEFETIMWDLLRGEWRDPNTAKNGRQGQQQNGVDILGQRNGEGGYIGVQCKCHGPNGKVTLAEVNEEIRKAEGFKPPLREYHIATTAPRDARLQEAVRLLSEERRKSGKFAVYVRFWDDIALRLKLDRDVAKRHYPGFFEHQHGQSEMPEPAQRRPQAAIGEKLQLFVSSRIQHGLKRERRAVVGALEDTAIARAWHWERDGSGADEQYLSVCFRNVHLSDGLV